MSGTYFKVTVGSDAEMNGGRKRGGWKTFPYIIVGVLGLTVGNMGWGANFYRFLTTVFNMKQYDGTQLNSIMSGWANFLPFVAAIVADSYSGNFPIIWISSFLSVVAMILLQLTTSVPSLRPPKCEIGLETCQPATSFQLAFLCIAIMCFCTGLGGTRYILSCFGADQFDELTDRDVFFNWYYCYFYLAAAIGYTGIVYIEDKISWEIAAAICLVVTVIGMVAILMGKKHYRHVMPQGSPFKSLARVVVASLRKRKAFVLPEGKDYYYSEDGSAPSSRLRFLNWAALKTEGDTTPDGSIAKTWSLCTVEEIEDFKRLTNTIPLWTSGWLASCSVGVQAALAVPQAFTMDRKLFPHFELPGATYLVASLLSTTIGIFIMDRFLYPAYAKITGRPLTPLQGIGVGHVITFLGICGSAIVESKRLHAVEANLPISASWLILPLGLVGLGEAFLFPGQMALYYQEFPESLRSTSTGMMSLTVAIGFYGGSLIIEFIRRMTPWVPDLVNITKGRLDNLLWVVAVMVAINFGYFLVCACTYKYQNLDKPEDNSLESKD